MSKPLTDLPPKDLIDRYLQAVGFWLPRAQKQDILAEISEDLRSQFEDREAGLGRSLTESEVAEILKQRGRPVLVASQFMPQQRGLIGPALYPIYIFVLKIVALCYVVPWLLVWFGILLFHRTEAAAHLSGEWHSLGTLWTVVFTQFGIVTLVFAAIDRASVKSPCLSDWDPRKLPKVRVETSTKRCFSALAGLVFSVFGLLWVLAIPQYPFLLIGPAAYLVKGAPVWQTVYWAIVLLAIASIFEHLVILLRPQLTWFPPTFKVATLLLSAWIVNALLHTHTYLLPAVPEGIGLASAMNLAIQIASVVWAAGLLIALAINGWQAIREIRRSMQPAMPHLA
ncbi:MAG: hypothetical protein JO300_13045 [Silvibacterium sp.]|nr:hypothetical protein [Silvibacterium sp.]